MQAGRLNLARELFMLSCNPDVRNYVSVIRAYGQDGNVPQAFEMLWELVDRGEADTSAYNSAFAVCSSSGDHASTATFLMS